MCVPRLDFVFTIYAICTDQSEDPVIHRAAFKDRLRMLEAFGQLQKLLPSDVFIQAWVFGQQRIEYAGDGRQLL